MTAVTQPVPAGDATAEGRPAAGSPAVPGPLPHDGDFYVTWTSAAGAHALHGPFHHQDAQSLTALAPAGARVVRVGAGAPALYLAGVLLSAGRTAGRVYPWAALVAAGVRHQGSSCRDAVAVALAHVLPQDAPDVDPLALAVELADLGFRAPAR